jgi:hypothetical protein
MSKMSKTEARQVAEKGVELYRRQKELKKELNEIKNDLRTFAEDTAEAGEKRVEIQTSEGEVLISFVDDSMSVSKMDKDDAEAFEMDLGPLVKVMFNKSVKYKTKDDFEEKLESLSAAQKDKIMEYITVKSKTPRVQFPR